MPPETTTAVRHPIFLFGVARSGTTLMRAILGQHSMITMLHEPELIFAMLRAGFPIDRPTSATEREALLQAMRASGSLQRPNVAKVADETLDRVAASPGELGFRQVYEALLPMPAEGRREIWGEKSLNNLFFVDQIVRLYPSAALIYMRRDPRGVALSKFRKNRRYRDRRLDGDVASIVSCASYFAIQARRWARWEAAADRGRSRHGAQWLDISYEDLVGDPERVTAAACAFIGVPYEPAMLDAAARTDDPVLRSQGGYAHQMLTKEPDLAKTRSYLDLPASISSMILRLTGYDGTEQRRPTYLQSLLVWTSVAMRKRHIDGQVRAHIARRQVQPPALRKAS